MTTLFTALHHIAALMLLVCGMLAFRQLRQPFSMSVARQLSRLDMVNGIAATVVLMVGLIRVVYFEKGFAYYVHSAPFLAKLGFYGLASVLSAIPTLEMIRWRAPLKKGLLPVVSANKLSALRAVALLQLVCLAAMAVCARLAASGVNG